MSADAAAGGSAPAWFIYYRVAASDLAVVCELVRRFQPRLRADWPGLTTELLRRPGEVEGQVTLMEVYRLPAATLVADLNQLAAAVESCARQMLPLLAGPRHTECFVPCA